MANQEITIHHVSDTALWVAHFRAQETLRADALFRDPLAGVLAGERGRKIAESMRATSRYTAWTLSIRTFVIDQYIQSLIAEGVDVVINLGCGLDTRPYRMELPPSLLWIEADYPQMIDYKEKVLAQEKPRCRLERARVDLADSAKREAFFSAAGSKAKRALVLTEGVIPYLGEAQVADLASGLHAQSAFKYWIAEYFAAEVYRYIRTPQRMKQMKNAPFTFFPNDWWGFFKKCGWIPRETKYLGEESVRLNRKAPAPWWAALFRLFLSKERAKKFRRFTAYVVFVKA